jgi:hypothetical protein
VREPDRHSETLGAEPTAHLDSRAIRQHDIEDHDVEFRIAQSLLGFGAR